ncbi:MAG: glycosyltransferase [Bacteroidetes bacterium]|nr:glycosyltransferase [Bacteroidota bacterium]
MYENKRNISQLVSVIIPSYNYGSYIGKAIESVLNQTYDNIELIIIDDASTDDTLEIISDEKYQGIKKIIHQNNKGNVSTFNEGYRVCSGKYVVLLSSDDEYNPTFIEATMRMFQNNSDLGVVYTEGEIIDNYGNIVGSLENNIHKSSGVFNNELVHLLSNCHIPHCSAVIKRSVIEDIGLYNQLYTRICDWDYWLRIASLYKVGFVKEPLYRYRRHGKNMSVSINTLQTVKSEVEVLIYSFFQNSALPSHIMNMKVDIINKHLLNNILRDIQSGFWSRGMRTLKTMINSPNGMKLDYNYALKIVRSFIKSLFISSPRLIKYFR